MDNDSHRNILLVGGGHTHWIVLERLKRYRPEGVTITLLSDNERPFYSGLVPGVIGGAYEEREAQVDLSLLCSLAGVTFVEGRAFKLDPIERSIHLDDGRQYPYDILSLNIGVGVPTHTLSTHSCLGKTKPTASLIRWYRELQKRIAQKEDLSLAIIGAGAAGVELALQLSGRYPRLTIHLLYDSKRILPHLSPVAARHARKLLRERHVIMYPEITAQPVPDGVLLDEKTFLAADAVLNATTAVPQPWLADSGVVTTEHGFLLVTESLQSLSHPEIFASGDIATIKGHSTPRAGVFAVKQGPYLAHNILAFAQGRALKQYSPQKAFLSILGAHNRTALAAYGPYALSAPWLWRLKEWIDLRFMKRFS